uniref:Putative LuxR-type DNA-binding HTH domain containing protein n=1 Tax=viral metagenome TaxID=1070528 RepID=A0A6H2A2Q2_9ZZZZ
MSESAAQTTLYGFETREPDLRRSDRSGCYDIKQLWQRSHEIIGLAIRGFKQKEIAEVLNISPVTVSNTLNSTLGREKTSEMREDRDKEFVDVAKEIARLSEKALKVYEQIFEAPSGDLKLKKETADTVLMDLGGHRAPTKLVTGHFTATAEEIESFKQRGIKAARDAGMLIEVKSGEAKASQASPLKVISQSSEGVQS